MPTLGPNPVDMTTVASAASWAGITIPTPDPTGVANNVQACLTAASLEFLRLTGRGPRNWQTATQSPFNQPVEYTEIYDGNGNQKLFLRNFPVNSVSSLLFGSQSVPASTGPGMGGYVVDNTGRAVALINGGFNAPDTWAYVAARRGGIGPFGGFPQGIQNITVSYLAGFNLQAIQNELQTVVKAWQAATVYSAGDLVSGGGYIQQAVTSGTSGTTAPSWMATGPTTDGSNGLVWNNTGQLAAPNTVVVDSISNGYPWLSNVSVDYFDGGDALEQVFSAPDEGEYFIVSPGVYLFNVADAGAQVLITYNAAGTPPDIVQAINNMVGLNYARRGWFGVRSVAMKDVGSTSYTTWAIDPTVKAVINYYTRGSI